MSVDVCGGSTNCCRADDELSIDHAEFEYTFGYSTGLDFKKEGKARDIDMGIIRKERVI